MARRSTSAPPLTLKRVENAFSVAWPLRPMSFERHCFVEMRSTCYSIGSRTPCIPHRD
jgi:hypothetical protein